MAEDKPGNASYAIFGSDSEDEDPPQQQEQAVDDSVAGLEEENEQAEDEQPAEARHQQDRMEPALEEDYEQQEEEQPTYQAQETRGPPMTIEAPLVQGPDPSKLRFLKTSNILGIDSRPFDPATFYQQDKNGWVDEAGTHVDLRHLNTLRWRWSLQEDGTWAAQSNARLVRWEDGSTHVFVGSEVLNAIDSDIASSHQHLYVRHKDLIQGQAPLDKRMNVQPTSLSAAFHKRLTAAADRRHAKQLRVRQTVTVQNPMKERVEREKREEARIREKEALERKQARKMQTFSHHQRAAVQRHGLTEDYLEADMLDEGDYDDDEDRDEDLQHSQPHASRGRYVDEEEEREREQRLARAKHATPTKPSRARQRDDKVQPFIDDEEAEEEDDVSTQKVKRQRRAVVLSDSDDE